MPKFFSAEPRIHPSATYHHLRCDRFAGTDWWMAFQQQQQLNNDLLDNNGFGSSALAHRTSRQSRDLSLPHMTFKCSRSSRFCPQIMYLLAHIHLAKNAPVAVPSSLSFFMRRNILLKSQYMVEASEVMSKTKAPRSLFDKT